MTASTSDKYSKTFNSTNPNVAKVQSTRSALGTTLACDNLAGWPTDTVVHFSTYKVGTDGKVTAGTQIDWKAVVSSNSLINLTRVAGASDTGNAINDYVEMNPTANWANDLVTGILVQHKQDGTHSSVTADSVTTTGNVSIGGTLTIAGSTSSGSWTPISGAISAVAYNGNRSYSLTTAADNTASISPGMRLRTTRTVSAPTQSTSLNGTTQYWVKTSPNKLTFTDDFVVSAWVKLSSYAQGGIVTRWNGTSGWTCIVLSTGQVRIEGTNAGAANFSNITSYQSLPLNKWVHITAQLDMSSFTNTATTSYVMFDGVDVPGLVNRGGTNPTSLVQAGNLEIGSYNGGTNLFPGKIAQVAIYNAKVTQPNIRATISQGLAGTETSLASAYSFSNSVVDLNTTTPNDLAVGGGSAVATNSDSPFGGQAGGTISATLDYLIVQTISSTTIVAQVAEGCTVPTSGGVSATSYAPVKQPFGFPGQKEKWILEYQNRITSSTTVTTGVWNNFSSSQLTVPIGAWALSYTAFATTLGTSAQTSTYITLSTSSSSASELRFIALISIANVALSSSSLSRTMSLSLSSATPYYLLNQHTGTGTLTGIVDGATAATTIYAENTYL